MSSPDAHSARASSPAVQQSPASVVQQPAGAKRGFHLWVDTLSKVVVIIAAVVGGVWGLALYFETTAPTLEPKTKMTSNIKWVDSLETKNTCWAEYSVALKNDGQHPFDINNAEVTAWLINGSDVPEPKEKPTLFGPDLGTEDRVVYRGPAAPIRANLSGHYPPGHENTSAAEFVFGKGKKSVAVLVIKIEVHGQEIRAFRKARTIEDASWTYDKVCP